MTTGLSLKADLEAMHPCDATSPNSDEVEPPSAVQIAVANEQTTLAVDETKVRAAIASVLQDSAYRSAHISVALVDDLTIHELNRQYLQHDYPTDVLSFMLDENETHLEGELVVSTDTAVRNAVEYGWSAENEMLLYLVHGALHLVGYLDKSPEECAAMHAAEVTHLTRLGVALPVDRTRWQGSAELAGEEFLP